MGPERIVQRAGRFYQRLLGPVLLLLLLLGCKPSGVRQDSSADAAGDSTQEDLAIYFAGIATPADLFHGVVARDAGQAVVFITHNFRHAPAIADEIVVLSHGRRIGRFDKGEVDLETLIDIVSDRGGEAQ